MKKVEVFVSPDIDQAYPEQWGAQVIVHMKDGVTIDLSTAYPKGDPENSVTKDELYRKFIVLTGDLPRSESEQMAANVLSLDELDDLSILFPHGAAVQ